MSAIIDKKLNKKLNFDIEKKLKQKPREKKSPWQKAANFFSVMAEVANIGIALEMIAKWFQIIAILAASSVGIYLTAIAHPAIYFFRAMIRLTRVVGRLLGVQFEEEKLGTHPLQTVGDIFSLSFFALAVAFFLGAIVAPPVGITIAWAMGLGGLCFVGYFDYTWPEQLAKEKHERLQNDPLATQEMKEEAEADYTSKLNSKRLFMALLVGLALLLICGSAVAFAPPLLVPILLITSKVASIFLTAIACGRFLNWCFSGPEKEKKNTEELSEELEPSALDSPTEGLTHLQPTAAPSPQQQQSLSSSESASVKADKPSTPQPSRNGWFSRNKGELAVNEATKRQSLAPTLVSSLSLTA